MRTLGSSFLAAALAATSFAALATVAGCSNATDTNGNGSSDPEAVNSGTDVTDVESNALSVASSISGGTADNSSGLTIMSQTLTGGGKSFGQLSAQDIGDAAKAIYQPAGCLVVTNDTSTSTATYAFTNCTGPYGLVNVDGTLTVGYTAPSATELKLSFSIDAPFTLTGAGGKAATVTDWQATADITASGTDLTTRTLQWNGHLTGTTRRGTDFDHSSTWTISWTVGGDCISESGSSSGTAGDLSVSTTVTSFQACAGSCPASGSEIKITDTTDGASYDLTYGNDSATYTNPAGKMYTYVPLCAY
jgi:hypothetical protein